MTLKRCGEFYTANQKYTWKENIHEFLTFKECVARTKLNLRKKLLAKYCILERVQ